MTGIRRGVRFACGSHGGSYCGAGMRCGTIAHPLCATQLRANHAQLFICINSIKKPSAFQKQIYPTECPFNKHRKIGFSVVLQIYLCDFRKRLLVFCKDDSDSPRPLTAVQT
jgi:hypothetical protein